ncbi:MAG TPA: hypothetical protein VG778_04105 [Blastocatellia bacterium]|jgi:hypothetical protein|nr:hypothetical protein [Blastocatellia bacterium]
MKKLMMALVTLGMAAAMASASAPPTSFAGSWELDKAKSEGISGRQGAQPDSITWNITQTDKTITIESKTMVGGEERAQSFTYNLDGTESTAEIQGRMPGKATLKAKWQGDGKILELNRVRNISAQGQEFTITTKEHLELAEGGKVLKVHGSTETPQGAREQKLTFNKK